MNTKEYVAKSDDYDNLTAGTIVYDKNHKVLLVLQTNGKWSVPKGSLKLGESFYEAALRETYEEAHIDLSPYKPIGIREHTLYGSHKYVIFIFKLNIPFTDVPLVEPIPDSIVETLESKWVYVKSKEWYELNMNKISNRFMSALHLTKKPKLDFNKFKKYNIQINESVPGEYGGHHFVFKLKQ